jgi:hypothetical protein
MFDDDEILRAGFFEPPPGFVDRVMAEIAAEAPLAFPTPSPERARQWQGVALAAAGLLGLAQLFAFAFGIWLSASAG